jgi:hypothetical protein
MIAGTSVVCAILIFSMYYYYEYKQRSYFLTPTISVFPATQFYKYDASLGYVTSTGTYTVTLTTPKADKPYVWTVTTDKDGYRLTSNIINGEKNEPEIWIFGCSYTWGWAVNDQDTLPWLIQKSYPGYYVKNYAGAGYGDVHALIKLKNEVAQGRKPVIAVFSYNNFHLPRNVAAPSRMNEFQNIKDVRLLHHPMGFIDDSGKLGIKIIPLVHVDAPDPDSDTMINVTKKIFDEILELCEQEGIKPILAFQTGDKDDPIVQYCQKRGFTIADISLDNMKPEYNNLPYDIHPNSKAHKYYADQLNSVIYKIIGNK